MEYTDKIKIALYGHSQSRKTLQAKGLIKQFGPENVVIVSCEAGLGTIRSALEGVRVYEVGSLDEYRKAYGELYKGGIKEGQWLFVDGGSRLLDWIQDEIWQGVNKAYRLSLDEVPFKDWDAAAKEWGVYITKKDGINTQGAWMRVGNQCRITIDYLIRLPSHTVMTFWAEYPNADQYTKSPQINVDTPGKGARTAVIGAFDFIVYLKRVKDRDYSLGVCNETPQAYAKVRDDWDSLRIPKEIEPFDLAAFVAALRAGRFE